MNETIEYVATCLFGLERFLGEEIDALGYERVETMDGRIWFRGSIEAIARCNLWFRTAERLYIRLGHFHAETFTELFDGVKMLPWENWIGKNDQFPVKGHAIKSKLFSVPDCQSIVKKAIVERLKQKYELSWFEETGVKYQIEFFIFNDIATLMIDTSGTALHKRGYRPQAGIAPLRETLAAAMVKIARPRENVLFWDPFCGSGTIPLEAALIMTNTAPGISRDFAAENFPSVPSILWTNAREEARSLQNHTTTFEAYASDIDPNCVAVTQENIRRAGMRSCVKAFQRDALTLETGGRRGTIVCNPPYGERMMTPEQTEILYQNMGKAFARLENWQIYVISSMDTFPRLYGRRADKIRKLYNGMIPCNYYQFFKNNLQR